LLDNLEQYELVCIDDLHVIAGKADWEEAVPSVQPPARQWPTLLIAASSSPRELPIKLADLKSRLTLALIFQMRGMSDRRLRGPAIAPRRPAPDRRSRPLHPHPWHPQHERAFDLLERLDQAPLQAQRKLTIPFLKETRLVTP
jgi:DnaA family protein